METKTTEEIKAEELKAKEEKDLLVKRTKEAEDKATEEQIKREELETKLKEAEEKLNEPKEIDLGDLTEFKVFKLRVKGFEGKGENKKKVVERDGNKHFKTCKLSQAQADELNLHSPNTLIEYKEK